MFLPSFRRRWTLPDFPPPRLASEWLPGGGATPVDCIWLWEWWCHAIRWDRRAGRMGRRGGRCREDGEDLSYATWWPRQSSSAQWRRRKKKTPLGEIQWMKPLFQLRLFPESLRWPLDIKQTRIHVLIQILREKNASVFKILCAFKVRYEFFCCCFFPNQF